jgi:hypothetical protein
MLASFDKHPIVGSVEPLSPEAAYKRLWELEAWGVDLSLVDASLSRTPTEQVERMAGCFGWPRNHAGGTRVPRPSEQEEIGIRHRVAEEKLAHSLNGTSARSRIVAF